MSTTDQAEEGVSLDAQREKLKQYCALFGIEVIGLHAAEGRSGGNLERHGLRSALRRLEVGDANLLIVCKLDRLTRSLRDLDMSPQA